MVNFIKRVPMLAANGDGKGGQLFNVYFPERYYEKLDTFQVLDTKQQMIVLQAPIRKSDNYWEYCVQLIDNTLEEELQFVEGMETRFLSNIQPEFSEEGNLLIIRQLILCMPSSAINIIVKN